MQPFWQILLPLALTVVIEGAVLALCARSFSGQAALLACNMITNPLLNALLVLFGRSPWFLIAGEVLVFAAEGLLLARLLPERRSRAFGCSFLCNAASFLAGLALFFL